MIERRPDHSRAPPPSSQKQRGCCRRDVAEVGDRVGVLPDPRTHVSPRKFATSAAPCSVRIDSGWNCTPSSGSVAVPHAHHRRPPRSRAPSRPGRRAARSRRASGSGPRRSPGAARRRARVRRARSGATSPCAGRPPVDGAAVRRDQALHAEADAEHRHRPRRAARRDRPRSRPARRGARDPARAPRGCAPAPSAADTSSCWTTRGSRPVTRRDQVDEVPGVGVVVVDDHDVRGGGHPHLRCEQVEDQVVDQVVAVLGEDRLGVELDPAVVRTAHAGGRRRSPGRSRP